MARDNSALAESIVEMARHTLFARPMIASFVSHRKDGMFLMLFSKCQRLLRELLASDLDALVSVGLDPCIDPSPGNRVLGIQ